MSGAALTLAFLAVSLAGGAAAEVRYVDTTKVNCRQAPSLSALVLVQFERDEPVTVIRARRGWTQVDNGPPCWIRSWLLSPEPADEPRGRATGDALRRPVWVGQAAATASARRSSSGVGT